MVECHHVVEKSVDDGKRFDVDNGICLCFDCHSKKHEYIDKYKYQRGRRAEVSDRVFS